VEKIKTHAPYQNTFSKTHAALRRNYNKQEQERPKKLLPTHIAIYTRLACRGIKANTLPFSLHHIYRSLLDTRDEICLAIFRKTSILN
jgi:hypothetical protein